jgi:hypothetical protein
VDGKRKKKGEHETRMDIERLDRISMDDIPVGI